MLYLHYGIVFRRLYFTKSSLFRTILVQSNYCTYGDNLNNLCKYLNITRDKAQYICLKHPVMKKLDMVQIEDVVSVLHELGFDKYVILEEPSLCSLLPITLKFRHTVLQECGINNITPNLLHTYLTIMRQKTIGELKESRLISKNINLENRLANYMTQWPTSITTLVYGDIDNFTLYSLRLKIIQRYLELTLDLTNEEFERGLQTYPTIKNRPLQSINKTLNILQRQILIPNHKIKANLYLIHADPDNLNDLIFKFNSIAGIDIKEVLRLHPKLAMKKYSTMLEIRKLLKEYGRDGANVAFFHPYCNAGGGGERVLWVAIKALLSKYPDTTIYIYTVETAEPTTILNKVQNQFNVKIEPERINFIRLSMQKVIEAKTYPYFTLLLQSLGTMVLGMEAFMKFNPDIYIDTMGCAFTYPIFRYLAQSPVGSYTHYPTITSAMMRRVKHRLITYNNSSVIARNPLLTWCKLFYYKLYGVVGRCADVVMVNGSWTEEHINELWDCPLNTYRVYPPCEVNELKKLRSLVKESDPIRVLSVAQFRPEKDHPLMLQAMYELRNLLIKNELLWNKIKLVLVGSCRNTEDEERVRNLKDLAKHLAIEDNVQFIVNASYSTLLSLYQNSSLAIHAMWNEHFGISVVECMAAGLITVAHKSGGPLADIVETSQASRTGFLASEADEYARAILEVIALSSDEKKRIVEAARASVDRFSEKEFEKSFLRAAEPLMRLD